MQQESLPSGQDDHSGQKSGSSKRTWQWPVLVMVGLILIVAAALAIIWYLSEPVQDARTVSFWISELFSRHSEAEAALNKLGPRKTAPYLLKTISGKDLTPSTWQQMYPKIYAHIPKAFRRLVPPLAPLPNPDRVQFVQSRAAYYLNDLAHKHAFLAPIAVPALVPLLANSNQSTRFSAGIALSGFGTNAAPAVDVIEKLVASEPGKTHDIMFHILEKCGPEAKRAIPALQKALSSPNPHVRIEAARTLWVLDSGQAELARVVARESLAAKDAGIRIESASLLWRVDKDATVIVPTLIELLNADGHGFEYRTILLLKQIGPAARDAIPAVKAWLKRTTRKEAFIHKAGADALQSMGDSPDADRP